MRGFATNAGGRCARSIWQAIEPAPVSAVVTGPSLPPPLPLPPPVSFSNGRAVSITMVAAACALAGLCILGLISPMLVPLGLCGAGFLAVRLYARRALQPPTMAEGARLGWMTGLWLFLILAVLVAITSLSISDPNFRQVFKTWAGSPEAARLVDDPHQVSDGTSPEPGHLLRGRNAYDGARRHPRRQNHPAPTSRRLRRSYKFVLIEAQASDIGKRLDAFLHERLPQFSRSRLQSWIKSGLVLVNGAMLRSSYLLRGQDAISVTPGELPPLKAEAEDLPLNILYEDDDVVAIDKPAGLVVHAGAGHTHGTLVNALLHHFGSLSSVNGELRPGIVHRLDRDTSGVLIAARTDAAHQALALQFQTRQVEKIYLALVHGSPRPTQGRITSPISRDPLRRTRMSTRSSVGPLRLDGLSCD